MSHAQGIWSSGMIPASGAGGPEFNSRNTPSLRKKGPPLFLSLSHRIDYNVQMPVLHVYPELVTQHVQVDIPSFLALPPKYLVYQTPPPKSECIYMHKALTASHCQYQPVATRLGKGTERKACQRLVSQVNSPQATSATCTMPNP